MDQPGRALVFYPMGNSLGGNASVPSFLAGIELVEKCSKNLFIRMTNSEDHGKVLQLWHRYSSKI